MRIKYHQQYNSRRRFSQLVAIAIVGIVIVSLLSITGQVKYITKYLYASSLSGVSSVSVMISDVHNTLIPKSTLLKENQELRIKLKKLQLSSLYNQSLLIENQHLKALLNTAVGSEGSNVHNGDTIARIIDYKSAPYGTILLKLVGNDTSTQVGDMVHFGTLAIGSVIKVNDKYVLTRLFTASNESYDVLVGDTVATFTGASNGSGEVVLSRIESVVVGTVVSLPHAGGLTIGIVEEIQRDDEDSMQTLLIKSPIAISQLHFISISHE